MKTILRISLSALLLFALGYASAAPTVVRVTDGGDIKADFILADMPTVSYISEGLSIVAGDIKVVYPAEATYTFSFSDAAGIGEVISDESVDMSQGSGKISVSGLKGGTLVSVFDVNGRLLASAKANEEGVANIDLSSFSGIAIVSTPSKTFKLILNQ